MLTNLKPPEELPKNSSLLKLIRSRTGYWEARNQDGQVVMIDRNPIRLLSALEDVLGNAITVIIEEKISSKLSF